MVPVLLYEDWNEKASKFKPVYMIQIMIITTCKTFSEISQNSKQTVKAMKQKQETFQDY